jgi:5-oxoprolinase (ATP-hydrolysing)
LSAYGIGVADVRVLRQVSVEAAFDGGLAAALPARFDMLAAAAGESLREQGVDSASTRFERRLLVKVAGADTALPVAWSESARLEELRIGFREQHFRHFGFRVPPDAALVVESLELEAVVAGLDAAPTPVAPPVDPGVRVKPIARRRVWCVDQWRNIPVYDRAALPAGARVTGPALIVEANATTIVEPAWRMAVHESGTLLLTRIGRRVRRESLGREADPVMLEVFNNLFMHVAEEMGIVLERTAHSVNIKERLDFSCALFSPQGALIANAPHIPVHLGSMGDSVQSILRSKQLAPGDSYLLNTPYKGGTHLPDLTVVTPVFDGGGQRLRYVVASRAHHARQARCRRRAAASTRRACCSTE